MKKLLLLLIRGYQIALSPFFGMHCRFHPTCSEYAREAIEVHGAVKGTGLALWRLLRCNPWCAGGIDEVPPKRR
jgi:putative membrane protein insertion efficiency factor